MTLFIVSLLVFLAALFTTLAFLGLWTYKDAEVKSSQPAGAWVLAALLIPNGIGFIAYLLVGRDKKDVPAPGAYKKALIAGVVVFVAATAFFIFGTVRLATDDFATRGTMNRGMWVGRTVSTGSTHWQENLRRGNGTSRRTLQLSAQELQNFHIDSFIQEGRLYLELEQDGNFSRIDLSDGFFGVVDLMYGHGFSPGRIRATLRYENVRHGETTLAWFAP